MEYLYPLTAVHISGYTEMLYDLDEVRAFIKKYGQFYDQHKYWKTTWYPAYQSIECYHDWIVRDDRGRVVKYDDVCWKYVPYSTYNKNMAKTRAIAAKGLPIPRTGCKKAGWKMNHTAKKNSGAGHRNRNRALCEYDRKEFGIHNKYGKPMPWEGY